MDRTPGMTDIRAGDTIARATLWSLLLLVVTEVAVEAIFSTLGLGARQYTFLWILRERFEDYFKFVLSFPAEGVVHTPILLSKQVAIGLGSLNPYRTAVSDLPHAVISHFHAPPLVALFCLGNANLMRLVDAGMLYLSLLAALAGYWLVIARSVGRTSYQRVAFGIAGLIAYPTMFMVSRGNVYAGVVGLLIVHTMLLAVRRERPMLAAALLALAINIRPNAAILLPLLPLLFERHRIAVTLAALGLAGGLFAAALAATHAVYPDYSWSSFIAGLAVYYRGYVMGGLGLAFGSSMFGAAKMLFGYRAGLDFWMAMPGLGIAAAAVLLAWRRRIEPAVLLFLLSAGYTLSSTVFADYHLLPFIAVPLVLARAGNALSARERWALIASCLVLAPKCYIFGEGGLSPQVVLNPLILTASSVRILVHSLTTRHVSDTVSVPALQWEVA